ncbi:MAG: VCBS repeat-containing protein [Acidobacteria bacterium]|nr:VCBS repeat-containing protein [Acidobacteriota bacterium]
MKRSFTAPLALSVIAVFVEQPLNTFAVNSSQSVDSSGTGIVPALLNNRVDQTTLNSLGSASSRAALLNLESMFTSITDAPMFADAGPFETSFWVDYDNDGFLDLFLTGGFETDPAASGFKNALYRNKGNGTFEKISEGIILTATTHAGSQSWGDYDNDGFMDVFIAQWGSRNGMLLRNSGNGSFTRVASNQSISQPGGPVAVWSDFNNDGFLDLAHHTVGRNTVLLGSADGTFAAPLLMDTFGGWNRAAADYDNDGFVDLIINAAPEGRHVLYRNARDGTFQRVTSGDIVRQAPGFFGMAWGDYDNDGFLDLFAARGPNGNTVLFHNERDGTLRQVSDSGLILTTRGWNPHWVDFDNDGYLDLFVTGDFGVASSLYRNNSDGTFSKMTTGSVATDLQAEAYGSAWGDYDHNGFMDLFIPNQSGGPHHLYRNNGNGNAWIQFNLVGTASNRAGIGAKVRVKAAINGKDFWQLRELIATEGYDGPGTLRVELASAMPAEWTPCASNGPPEPSRNSAT